MSQTPTKIVRLRVADILPNPFQPRQLFDDIDSLADSIANDGLLHRIVARPTPNGDGTHQILNGERRVRAFRHLQWEFCDAEVGDYSDLQMATLALKSDTEHVSFNVVEIAIGYRNLIEHFGKTNVQVAEEYKVSAPVVSNRMRLLALPASVLDLLTRGQITETHAKTLCSIIEDKTAVEVLGQRCADEQWSSRRLDAEVAPVRESLDAAEKAKSAGEQPKLIEEPAGGVERKGAPLVSVFESDDRIEWKSKLAPDAKIFGTVKEVHPKYLVVLPDGMTETIHLDFNVKKLPKIPKAEPAQTQLEAASQSVDEELLVLESKVLVAIGADQDSDVASISEETQIPEGKVSLIVAELGSRGLVVVEDNTFALTDQGESLLLSLRGTELLADQKARANSQNETSVMAAPLSGTIELSFEQKRILKTLDFHPNSTIARIAEEIDVSPANVAAMLVALQPRFVTDEEKDGRHHFKLTDQGEFLVLQMRTSAATPVAQDGAGDAANEAPEKSENDKQLESRAHESPAQKAGVGGVASTPPVSQGVGFATASSEGQNLKPAPKATPKPAPPIESSSPDMTATIPGAEADWLDEHDLNVATVCALYRRFHVACEGAGIEPENMIAELEGRAVPTDVDDSEEEAD
jgi:ParB family chromosome partitioning protein